MKKIKTIFVWVVFSKIFLNHIAQACPLPPTSIGQYYSGLKQVGYAVMFTGAPSHDNDGYNYGYTPRWEWDFDYNGTFVADVNTTSPYAAWTYAQPGTYSGRVIYYDNDGQQGNMYPFTITISPAENPKLLFTQSDIDLIRQQKWNVPTFPFNRFKSEFNNGPGMIKPNNNPKPTEPEKWADYDRVKALYAKKFAFRYLMDLNLEDGNDAFQYLYAKYIQDNYIYEADRFNRWMTNCLALTDYCIAYDLLAGSGYFEMAFGANAPLKKNEIKTLLKQKADSIYNRVKTNRTGNQVITEGYPLVWHEVFSFLGMSFGYPETQPNHRVLEEAKFDAGISNMRIIVASGLGVAGYLLKNDYHSEASEWLEYAKKDVEHFLLNEVRYQPDGIYTVQSQNVEGAFPEGIEYLNYSAEGFIPFMTAHKINKSGAEADYFQDPDFKKMMDWSYDIQLLDGSGPQINSTGYYNYPVSALVTSEISGSSKYLGQLDIYKNLGRTVGLPVEGFSLIASNATPGGVSFSKITDKSVQGEIVLRNNSTSHPRYLLVSAKNGPARYAAELHGYADAGSFIFGTNNKMLVRHPGYTDYQQNAELEHASAHNTICPIVSSGGQWVVGNDAPYRTLALPPSTDANFTKTYSSTNFDYTRVYMELNGMKAIPNVGDVIFYLASLNKTYEYIQSHWIKSKANMQNYGSSNRNFLMMNDKYLIISDEINSTSINSAVSYIHGNNGNRASDANGVFDAGVTQSGDETKWETPSDEGAQVLRVNTFALGGKLSSFSGLIPAKHQTPVQSAYFRNKYYHAALRTECRLIGNGTSSTGRILSILEIDNNSSTPSSTVTKRNLDIDNYLLSTVDGRGKTYGRYDVIFSQASIGNYTFTTPELPYPIKTDASFLVISFDGSSFTNTSTMKIFANNATYINYGSTTFIPNSSGEAQTSFTTTTIQNYSTIDFFSTDPNAHQNNGQRRFSQTKVNDIVWLHQVFTSRENVWIEHSSDGGQTWILGNNGQPLNSDADGKNPSIAFTSTSWGGNPPNYHIGVVWQEKYNSKYKIKGRIFNQLWNSIVPPLPCSEPSDIWEETTELYNSVNANPNLVMTPYFHIASFEKKIASDGLQPGINVIVGHNGDGGSSGLSTFNFPRKQISLDGTDSNSTNAQLSLSWNPSITNIEANLIYQTSPTGVVKYKFIGFFDIGSDFQYYFDTPISLTPYTPNVSPSIIGLPNHWFAASWIEYDQLVYIRGSNLSVRHYYSSGVKSASINSGGVNSNSGFVVWSQQSYSGTWSNKSLRFDDGVPLSSSNIQNLSTTGKYIQVGNGVSSGTSDMYISSFYPFTTPYYFSTPNTSLSKANSNGIITGRGFIISNQINTSKRERHFIANIDSMEKLTLTSTEKDGFTFTFRFDGLNVDGKSISFIDALDTLDYSKVDILNSVLETEPFQITSNSRIIFTERSGFADSTSAVKALDSNRHINYKVDLIDAASNSVIGTIRNEILTSANVPAYKKPLYLLNTRELGSKTVKAKITVTTNLEDVYTILTKSFTDENETLEKSSLIELSLEGIKIPTVYALEQNYPNPFNPTTTIRYQLPVDGMITIKVYDALGREVRTLVNEEKSAGYYSAPFEASTLASGMYIYRIIAQPTGGSIKDIFTSVKKMLLLK